MGVFNLHSKRGHDVFAWGQALLERTPGATEEQQTAAVVAAKGAFENHIAAGGNVHAVGVPAAGQMTQVKTWEDAQMADELVGIWPMAGG